MRRWWILTAIGACALVIALAVSTNDGAEEPANTKSEDPNGPDDLSGLGSEPVLEVGTDPRPGERVLASGSSWIFVITPDQELVLRRPRSASTVSGFARPVTLNEATAWVVRRGDTDTTLVAGPVHDDAAEVGLVTVNGIHATSEVFEAHDLRWFFAEIRGSRPIDAITAMNEDGEELDQLTDPRLLPNRASGIVRRGARPPRSPRGKQARALESEIAKREGAVRAELRKAAAKARHPDCPSRVLKAEPLPDDAVNQARRFVLDREGPKTTARVRLATESGARGTYVVKRCGEKIAHRTVIVFTHDHRFDRGPNKSASLAQGVVAVSLIDGTYGQWARLH